jgi:phage major head subunit gpT-like protein
MKASIALIVAFALLSPLVLQQVNAQEGTVDRTVIMKITNKKTGIVHTKTWYLTSWTFGERPIEVSDNMLRKIHNIYHTDSFDFTLNDKVFRSEWLHFGIEMTGSPLVGKGLSIKFV